MRNLEDLIEDQTVIIDVGMIYGTDVSQKGKRRREMLEKLD